MENNIKKDRAVLDVLERHAAESSRNVGTLMHIVRRLPKPGLFSSGEYNRTFNKLESLVDSMQMDFDKVQQALALARNTIRCNQGVVDKMDLLLNTEDDEICLDA